MILQATDISYSNVKLEVLPGNAYSEFIKSLNTKRTKQLYSKSLVEFARYVKVDDSDDLLTIKNLQKVLIDYLEHLRTQKYSYTHRNIVKSALRRFYDENDIINLNWKKISRRLGSHEVERVDRDYTHKELQILLEAATTLKVKALITLLASSGVRLGAVVDLIKGDLTEVENFAGYKLRVYRDSAKWQYDTFISPESRHYVDEMLKARERDREKITDQSPLFRTVYDPKNANEDIKKIEYDGLKSILTRLRTESGLVKQQKKQVHGGGSDNKYAATQMTNAFRKFFYNALDRSGVEKDVKEYLSGRGRGIGVSRHYWRPDENRLLSQYKKALSEITISDADRTKEILKEQSTTIQQQLKQESARRELLEKELARIKSVHLERMKDMDEVEKQLETYVKNTNAYHKKFEEDQNKRFNEDRAKIFLDTIRLQPYISRYLESKRKSSGVMTEKEIRKHLQDFYDILADDGKMPWEKPVEKSKKKSS